MSPKSKKSKKNKSFKPGPGHVTPLSAVASSHTGVDVFGKVVEPVVAGLPDDHQMAEIYGYRDQSGCVRFPVTERISLPAPDGLADGCGWDPASFVVWRDLPRELVTKQLVVKTTTVHEVLMAAKFQAGLESERTVDDVLHDWLIRSVPGQPIPDTDELDTAWSTLGSGGPFSTQVQQNLADRLNQEFSLNPALDIANLPANLKVGQLKLNLHRSA